jgi:hypothetical protein
VESTKIIIIIIMIATETIITMGHGHKSWTVKGVEISKGGEKAWYWG